MIHIIPEVKEVWPRKKEQNSYPIHTYSTHPASVPRDGLHAVLYWSEWGQCRSVLTEMICLSCFFGMMVSSGANSDKKQLS